MKIFSASQVRDWDQFTISNTPIASIDLMEKAAAACHRWIRENLPPGKQFLLFCGNGNNGGDGLAIARMLVNDGQAAKIFITKADKRSRDCDTNLQRLYALNISVSEIATKNDFPQLESDDIVIDALFGTGLNKPLQGLPQLLAEHINAASATVISIDMPSGLFADNTSVGNTIIKAGCTLSFECYKLAFMFAENSEFTGDIHLLSIGLSREYYLNTTSNRAVVDNSLLQPIYQPRKSFTHKYSYGHALIYAGSTGMMGAALLCAKACLRSGAGLVTVHTKEALMPVIQTALPEAIASGDDDFERLSKKKAAIGFGPGLEINDNNTTLLRQVLTQWMGPLVIDAAGLHLLQPMLDLLPKRINSPVILTPHTGEFEMLLGKTSNDFERAGKALQKAAELHCYIILKGKNSLIACPGGHAYFNSTGNSGMATAGSGDVLTGMLTGLLAQGYNALQSCLLAVYLHGLAGDFAAAQYSPEAMIAGDITEQLGKAFSTFADEAK
jgi:NAD(P)H-hydrate epimerase